MCLICEIDLHAYSFQTRNNKPSIYYVFCYKFKDQRKFRKSMHSKSWSSKNLIGSTKASESDEEVRRDFGEKVLLGCLEQIIDNFYGQISTSIL